MPLLTNKHMESCMFGTIFKQHQIFKSIVLPVFNRTNGILNSSVMDYFFSKNRSLKMFFHNKSGSFNIFSFCERMIGLINKNIAIDGGSNSALPMSCIFSSKMGKYFSFCRGWVLRLGDRPTFQRTVFSFMSMTWFNFKYFFTYKANFFNGGFFVPGYTTFLALPITFLRTIFFVLLGKNNQELFFTKQANFFKHCFLQIKKPAFRYLTETRLRVSTLLTGLSLNKKVVFPLDITSIHYDLDFVKGNIVNNYRGNIKEVLLWGF